MSVDFAPDTAVVARRYAQFVLDRLLLLAGTVLVFVAGVALGWLALRGHGLRFVILLPLIGSVLVGFAGNLWMEVWLPHRHGGATPAMRWLGLRIVTLDGEPPSLGDFAVRWLLFTVDGLLFGVVGAILIAVTERHQRLGDLVARTIVVRVR